MNCQTILVLFTVIYLIIWLLVCVSYPNMKEFVFLYWEEIIISIIVVYVIPLAICAIDLKPLNNYIKYMILFS